jgi:hypothetical protein
MKKQIAIILLGSLFLTAQGARARPLIVPEYEHYHVQVTVVPVKTHKELIKTVKPYMTRGELLDAPNLRAYSVMIRGTNQCIMFVHMPKREKQFIDWGHELGHCVYGRWHSDISFR